MVTEATAGDFQLVGWGTNSYNCLGADVRALPHPVKVSRLGGSGREIAQVSASTHHSAVIVIRPGASGGKLYTTGLGSHGRLGFTKETEDATAEEAMGAWHSRTFTRVNFGKRKISRVACGPDHTMAIDNKGELHAWGMNDDHALGVGQDGDVYWPALVLFKGYPDIRITHVACGAKHTLACCSEGRLYTWGHPDNHVLGNESHQVVAFPQAVTNGLETAKIVQVAASFASSGAVSQTGEIYCWGSGGYGRLGLGSFDDVTRPRKQEKLTGVAIIQLALGSFHGLALGQNGNVYGWGSGTASGVAEGGAMSKAMVSPQRVQKLSGYRAVQLSVGLYHSLILLSTGDIVGFSDKADMLGVDESGLSSELTFIPELRSVCAVTSLLEKASKNQDVERRKKDIAPVSLVAMDLDGTKVACLASGSTHSGVVVTTNELYMWGENDSNQCSFGSGQITVPTLMQLSMPVTSVACGGAHTIIITKDAQIFTWGRGREGQLGINSIPAKVETPTNVPTLQDVIYIAAGVDTSAAIISAVMGTTTGVSSGILYTWGNADLGKLGLGPDTSAGAVIRPTKVAVEFPVRKVFLSQSHTIALCANDSVWGWGAGRHGKLGARTVANYYVPTEVMLPPNTKIDTAALGKNHTVFLSTSGRVWTCGFKSMVCQTTDAEQPIEISDLICVKKQRSSVRHVAVYGETTIAITGGFMFIWGRIQNYKKLIADRRVDREPIRNEELATSPIALKGIPKGSFLTMGRGFTIVLDDDSCLHGFGSFAAGTGTGKRASEILPTALDCPWTVSQATAARDGGRFSDLNLPTLLAACRSPAGLGWSTLQAAIRNEPADYSEVEIHRLQTDLSRLLKRLIEKLLTNRDEDTGTLHPIHSIWMSSTLRTVAGATDCELPILHRQMAGALQHDDLMQVLLRLHRMVSLLALQPAYILRLIWSMDPEKVTETQESSIKNFIWDMSRVNSPWMEAWVQAFGTLCIQKAKLIRDVFQHPNWSYALLALLTQMEPLMDHLLNPSRSVWLQCMPSIHYIVSLKEETELTREETRQLFQLTVKMAQDAVTAFVSAVTSLTADSPLFRLSFAWVNQIQDMSFSKEARPWGEWKPVASLLLTEFLPVLCDAAPTWMFERRMTPSDGMATALPCLAHICRHAKPRPGVKIDSMRRAVLDSVPSLATFLGGAVLSSQHDMNIHVKGLIQVLGNHLEVSTRPLLITTRPIDVAIFINMLRQYQSATRIGAFDALFDEFTIFGPSSRPFVFERPLLESFSKRLIRVPFEVERRFMLEGQPLVYDMDTGYPVPQYLAKSQAADGLDAALVKPVAAPGAETSFANALRMSPPMSDGCDWQSFNKEMLSHRSYFSRIARPDLETAGLIDQVLSYVQSSGKDLSARDVQERIIQRMMVKKAHRIYLESLQEAERDFRGRADSLEQQREAVSGDLLKVVCDVEIPVHLSDESIRVVGLDPTDHAAVRDTFPSCAWKKTVAETREQAYIAIPDVPDDAIFAASLTEYSPSAEPPPPGFLGLAMQLTCESKQTMYLTPWSSRGMSIGMLNVMDGSVTNGQAVQLFSSLLTKPSEAVELKEVEPEEEVEVLFDTVNIPATTVTLMWWERMWMHMTFKTPKDMYASKHGATTNPEEDSEDVHPEDEDVRPDEAYHEEAYAEEVYSEDAAYKEEPETNEKSSGVSSPSKHQTMSRQTAAASPPDPLYDPNEPTVRVRQAYKPPPKYDTNKPTTSFLPGHRNG